MGYSRALVTLESRLELVKPLASTTTSVKFPCESGTERELAYQIREALHVAKLHPDAYPEITAIVGGFTFKEVDGAVLAIPKRSLSSTPEAAPPSHFLPLTPEEEAAVDKVYGSSKPTTVNNPSSIIEIISIVKEKGPSGLPYHFPNSHLQTPELRTLVKWLTTNGYLLFWANPGITIKAYTEDLAPVATTLEDLT